MAAVLQTLKQRLAARADSEHEQALHPSSPSFWE